MTRASRRRAVAFVGMLCIAAHAPQAAAEMQTFTLRPIVLIEGHLYDGGLNNPESVFIDDARGEIWVADTKNHRIGIFDKDGMPLFSFTAPGVLRDPRLVRVDPNGTALVLEQDRTRIRRFNYRGVYLGDLEPKNFAVDGQIATFCLGPDSTIWIGEARNGEVLVYDYPSMRLRRRFGSRGDEEGQFQAIASIAVDGQYVYVLDHTALAVQLFSHRGDFVRGWGQHSLGGANFSLPRALAVDAKGRIAVTDGLRQDVKYFDAQGKLIGHFGGAGRNPGSVLSPSGIAIGNDGRVYVVDRGNARVQIWQEEALERPVPVQ
jgi:tripartite motif-containing protein 71